MTRANIKRIKRGEPPKYKAIGPEITRSIPKFCKIDNNFYNLRNGKQISTDIVMKFKKFYQRAVKKLLKEGNRDFTYYSYDIINGIVGEY